MPITIRPLLPGDAETFAGFFDRLEFAHAREWKGCYCRYYHHTVDFAGWIARTPETNRKDAIDRIREGAMQGFLAFDGDRCVGWLNAGPLEGYARLQEWLQPYAAGRKAAVTICFVIDPDYRNQGLARAMLAHALGSFREKGMDCAFSLPNREGSGGERRYRGTMHMYEEAGYREIGAHGETVVMERSLA